VKKLNSKTTQELPPIPSKRFFSIREAAKLCGVKPHVLRYWEVEFSKLKPTKGNGGHRHYTSGDIELARKIRHLLYDRRFTITGAKQQLKNGNKTQAASSPPPPQAQNIIAQDTTSNIGEFISQIVTDLEALLEV